METLALEISDYELERGKPMPSINHSAIQLNIGFELKTRYREQFRFLSEINVAIAGRVMVPDIGIFPKMALDMANDSIVVQQVPLSTIEILSPSQALSELIGKANAYFQAGVKSCWIVLPEVSGIFVYAAPGKYTFFHDGETLMDAATGIELPLAPLFE
ncbi:Uma2 family endonuclease [Hymenobacter convexus]|uniref:Uma2 family endonuclease n=1 Tax=Hymenobacter sp. CA1UV-4 TaxID=3063782 RepID=UPI0027132E74|nr:Uma2 family endonuclease [Hymenobacter sp. CA1UV-4]MDO7852794.1 Uma2 family endonuclease [Hymenobacter sp. CA1UV-4]